MSFVLQQKPTYVWPIVLLIPNDGKQEKFAIDLIYNRLDQDRINEIVKLARISTRSTYDEDAPELVDKEVAKEILAGWNGVLDDNGDPEPFTDSKVETFLKIPTVASQVVRKWFESIDISKRKN